MNFQLNPEHRSITNICVVEDLTKCPLGYTPILRTADQDLEADLWKDGFFGRRVTRYVCVSKSQGRPEHVISSIQIIYDKDTPPEGFSLIQQTVDSSQKAFQKKLLCFKLGHYRSNAESIVEIVILTKLKAPYDGFEYEYVGDINGMHFCTRKISALTRLNSAALGYGISPHGSPGVSLYPEMKNSFRDISLATGNPNNPNSTPTSPPQAGGSLYGSPNPLHPQSNKTLGIGQFSIDGVPFVLHEKLQSSSARNISSRLTRPTFNIKSETEIANEYNYDFMTERNILITNGC